MICVVIYLICPRVCNVWVGSTVKPIPEHGSMVGDKDAMARSALEMHLPTWAGSAYYVPYNT